MFFLGRIKDAQKSLSFATSGTEFQMLDRSASHELYGPAFKIFNRHIFDVLLQESLRVGGLAKSLRTDSCGYDAVDDRLLPVADPTVFS